MLPDLQTGGGQQVLLRHLRCHLQGHFEHHVAYFAPDGPLEPAFRANCAGLHLLPHRGGKDAPSTLASLCALIRRHRISIVHTNGTPVDKRYGQLAAAITGRPVVSTLHGMRPDPGTVSLKPRALAERVTFEAGLGLERILDPRTVVRFVAVSDAVRDAWQPYLARSGIRPEDISVIYSGIPLEAFDRPPSDSTVATLRERGIERDDPVLIAVTRLDSGKNVHALVALMRVVLQEVPDARLVVVGDGPERGALDARIRAASMSDAVVLLGRRDDVPDLLQLSRALVFTSLREGFGLVVVEALATATPVVAFDLPSLRRLRELDAGILWVGDRRPESLARAAVDLLKDTHLARNRGARGREVVRNHWDVRISARAYERVYDEVLASRGGTGYERK
jgi:glycosyltransferase involved in cell wall biosynthesis